METECEKRLQLEREKLNRLVDEALENGTPIEETYQIMRQCRRMKRVAGYPALRSGVIYAQSQKVDMLIEQVGREKEYHP